MPLAISDDHLALAETVASYLTRHNSLGLARQFLDGADETLDAVHATFADTAELGWLGLHVPEEFGGSGFGLEELAVVVEQFGRQLASGPFVPTTIASAFIAAGADDDTKARLLPGLVDGSTAAGVALDGSFVVEGDRINGSAGAVVSAPVATVLVLRAGDDVAIVETGAEGLSIETPANVDPSRRSARVTAAGTPATIVAGAASTYVAIARTVLAAEAVGVAAACTDAAAAYAKERKQFGRVIATFQAVKHHCANMLVATELATGLVWDATRASTGDADQFSLAAAVAVTAAVDAAQKNAPLNTQVHGGIGFTWEHDAHLYLRRATALAALVTPEQAAIEATSFTRAGVRADRSIELPPEAEPIRTTVREFVASVDGLDAAAVRDRLIETGYAMPHWPKPWGRDAAAIEQLVVEEEFKAAGIKRPQLGITSWVILTLIQHATADQVDRWVLPALRQDVVWCQLFSEPDAGSDAAGITTKATRVDGGWLVNGQKVWTSGAHISGFGLATVRTNPDVPKHQGITMMVIDMKGPGVEVRRLKMPTGESEFNEVFFNDVFVPDDDVVGPIDGGWTVARATLGNESVSIGGGTVMALPSETLVAAYDGAPDRLPGGEARIGRYIATHLAIGTLNLRSAHRAVAGGGPGPEGAITKLVLSELGEEAAAISAILAGPDAAYLDGPGALATLLVLTNRGLSIAGGTSEIKRNQIGERILGLPRDPLIV